MFNFRKKEALTQAPVAEVIDNTPKVVKIASVKHLMAAALVNQAIQTESAKIEAPITPTIDAVAKVEKIDEPKFEPIAIENASTVEEKLKPEIKKKTSGKKEFVPFTQITPPAMEVQDQVKSLPKHVSTWFINNLSNLMNGLPVDKSEDFYTLMNKLTQDDSINPTPSHIGLHKIKHFIKTQMSHIFDTNTDEFITINLTTLDDGVMLMGATPDNNIVLAGNLSSLKTSDWDTIHTSLQSQLN